MTPEQWTGCAEAEWLARETRDSYPASAWSATAELRSDAQDDMLLKSVIEDWNWPTSSHGWGWFDRASWPASSYGWRSRGWNRGDAWGPRHTLDRKDIAKPENYGGDITKWAQWSTTFVRYMGRHDEKWFKSPRGSWSRRAR